MKLTNTVAVVGAFLPGALAWGSFGHITIAYIASNLVQPDTTTYFQTLLQNSTTDYLAGVATWADSIRYMRWAKFTSTFHFIDAKDSPPHSCNVDFERDCKASGCVVSALHNYTSRLMDMSLPAWQRNQAAKFVIHFVGDIHQPLHDEDVLRGGNGIMVRWHDKPFNLHHVWDSSIAERLYGGRIGRGPRVYEEAARFAAKLTGEITAGKFAAASRGWEERMSLGDPQDTAMGWAQEGNAYVCSHVLPEGVEGIVDREVSGEYYEKAAPVVELQLARAGYRLAKWLDLIAVAIAAGEEMEDL